MLSSEQQQQDGASPLPSPQTIVNIPLINTNGKQEPYDQKKLSNNKQQQPLTSHLLSPNQINQCVKDVKQTFNTNKTKDVKFRKEQLRQLAKMVEDNEKEICDALILDLNKPPFETKLCEKGLIQNEIIEFLHRLDDYTKPQHKAKTLLTFFDDVYVKNEPLGTVLIMGAWNYPLLLSLSPFAGAIAAGNCAILKMSEHAPNVGKAIAELCEKYLDKSCYKVINCDFPTTQYLLAEHKFDHIFYTGGENGGRAVYAAASKNLTPIVLELGGKSPVYIDDDVADKEALWSRLFWGKFINAGQTCIAPDYVLCSEKTQQLAKKHFHNVLKRFYNGDIINSEYYTRIVNNMHFERLKKLLKDSRIVIGGKLSAERLSIEPAIILDASLDDAVMRDEIFGPILPFVTCSSVSKAIDIINSRPKPLALYVFSNSKKVQNMFLNSTSSGGVCMNDTILHISAISLPFGGVGNSGFGKYHGEYSLDVFSNKRSILARGYNPVLELIGKCRYPPYKKTNLTTLLQLGANRKLWTPGPVLGSCLAFVTGVASVLAYQALALGQLPF